MRLMYRLYLTSNKYKQNYIHLEKYLFLLRKVNSKQFIKNFYEILLYVTRISSNPVCIIYSFHIVLIHRDMLVVSFLPLFILSYTLLPKRIVYHAWLVSTVYYYSFFFNLLLYIRDNNTHL